MVNAPVEALEKAMVSFEPLDCDFRVLIEFCKAEGTAKPSFYMYCLQNMDMAKDVEQQKKTIQNTAAVMYAGTDFESKFQSSF